jgi:AmmeMemoRadiSam system protein B/AmmeMemoRadiSam system protein A
MKGRWAWLLIQLVLLACGTTSPSELVESSTPPTSAPVGTVIVETSSAPTPGPTSKLDARDVHKNEGAGRWYPADPGRLQAAVDTYVRQAEVDPVAGQLLAVIVPHAGYLYSGAVAGYSFRAMQEAGCADHVVVVIGDTHTGNGTAEIAIWAEGSFETPLGSIPIDETVGQALVTADGAAAAGIEFDRKAFTNEHPVENQLPFVQTVCPGARIVPIVIHNPSLQNARVLAGALVAALGDRPALIVASTDLSHYHSYDEARAMDEVALQAIASLDPKAVADSPQRCAELGLGGSDPLTMCSQGSVMTALIVAQRMGADRASVLHYANSGDVPLGKRDQVVGYGAVALWESQDGVGIPASRSPEFSIQSTAESNPAEKYSLSPEAQEELLVLARKTVTQFLQTETFPTFHTDDPALLQPLGAYVTYEKQGELRGCVGRIEADRPAFLNVQYAAVAAALADSRFPAIAPEELEELDIEITLLEPLRQVESPDEIQIGRDGVLMRVGADKAALYLPQVPPEQGWDLQATLLNLCRKAGLPDDAWQRDDARFYAFTGQWFAEGE